eukprot:TRINITY_DN39737_c0_g1_i1.p1 TRINITY_DN39737_c0_g1~~TRINITY_DN39737_c0_g1_i1.p1  ORF type:complete len:188 (-),score=5.23 TRINITY_DN39737_c0_g1_i1:23-586(-)
MSVLPIPLLLSPCSRETGALPLLLSFFSLPFVLVFPFILRVSLSGSPSSFAFVSFLRHSFDTILVLYQSHTFCKCRKKEKTTLLLVHAEHQCSSQQVKWFILESSLLDEAVRGHCNLLGNANEICVRKEWGIGYWFPVVRGNWVQALCLVGCLLQGLDRYSNGFYFACHFLGRDVASLFLRFQHEGV